MGMYEQQKWGPVAEEQIDQLATRLYPLEIASEKDEVVNAGTINNEDDNQQCTDDIDEHSPLMRERPIRSSAAKARQNISYWSKEILGPAPEDVED